VDGGYFFSKDYNCPRPVGRSSDEGKLLNLINWAGSKNACVISVSGFHAVGKSALVKYVFHRLVVNYQTESSRFHRFFWVDVPYPFNFIKFCRIMHSLMYEQAQTASVCLPQKLPDDEIKKKNVRSSFSVFRAL
jgi:predicted ATPase